MLKSIIFVLVESEYVQALDMGIRKRGCFVYIPWIVIVYLILICLFHPHTFFPAIVRGFSPFHTAKWHYCKDFTNDCSMLLEHCHLVLQGPCPPHFCVATEICGGQGPWRTMWQCSSFKEQFFLHNPLAMPRQRTLVLVVTCMRNVENGRHKVGKSATIRKWKLFFGSGRLIQFDGGDKVGHQKSSTTVHFLVSSLTLSKDITTVYFSLHLTRSSRFLILSNLTNNNTSDFHFHILSRSFTFSVIMLLVCYLS